MKLTCTLFTSFAVGICRTCQCICGVYNLAYCEYFTYIFLMQKYACCHTQYVYAWMCVCVPGYNFTWVYDCVHSQNMCTSVYVDILLIYKNANNIVQYLDKLMYTCSMPGWI